MRCASTFAVRGRLIPGLLSVLLSAAGCGGGSDSSGDVPGREDGIAEQVGDADAEAVDPGADGDEDGDEDVTVEVPTEDAGGDAEADEGSGGCTDDLECDDGIECTMDTCDVSTGVCGHTVSDLSCNDGNPCTGEERCDAATGCVAGTPTDCNDSIVCTEDACDPLTGACRNRADHTRCTAPQICDPAEGGCTDPPACTTDDDCTDDDACNGIETCGPDSTCRAGVPVVCDDGTDCTIDSCDPDNGGCSSLPPDLDGDTYPDEACAGTDCDDSRASVHPDAMEACNAVDDDCNGVTDETFECVRGVTASCRTTCGSTSTRTCSVSCAWGGCPPPAETCNGLDDDCNGIPDDGYLCAVGTSEIRSCGLCATQSRTCTAACDWTPWDTCAGGGECSIGETETRACACGGSESRTCSTSCIWGDWSGCATGACTPGWTRPCATTCDPAGSQTGLELCMAGCSWSGVCTSPVETCNGRDDDCDGACDDGWACCAYQVVSCTTACGTAGTGTCTASCGSPPACCAAAETCGNGCDDDCNGVADNGCSSRSILVLMELCGSGTMDHVTPALANLGLLSSATFVSTVSDLSAQLSAGTWDLVIVDEYSNGIDSTTMDQLLAHVNAGRPLILSYWALWSYASHGLIARAGVSLAGEYYTPLIAYRWVTSPLFTTPNLVPDLTWSIPDPCGIDGQYLTTTTATAHAGFTTTVQAGQAALTVSSDHLFLLNGFTPQLFTDNADGDGKLDMVELYENEIDYLF